jgi:hypothetical protein
MHGGEIGTMHGDAIGLSMQSSELGRLKHELSIVAEQVRFEAGQEFN